MPAVGLDVSDSAVTALELVRRGGNFAVGRFGRRELALGAVVGGYINDKEAAVRALAELKAELGLDFIAAALSDEKAYLFKLQIPRVEKKEIRGVIDFKLEENVPIPPREAVFDYTIITPEAAHAAADHLDVGVTALPRKVVETYGALFDAAGLVALSFETEAQAIARASVPRGDRDTYLIVNFGETRTGLSIVSDEVVHFTSSVAWGGRALTEAIAKHLSVSPEEAQSIKRERAAFADRKNTDLFLSLASSLGALKDEVNKLSAYWQTREEVRADPGQGIKKIILTGRDAALPGFDEYLTGILGASVEQAAVWQNAFQVGEYIPPISLDESLDYAAAIGLALPKY